MREIENSKDNDILIAQHLGWTQDEIGAWYHITDSSNYCMCQSKEDLPFSSSWDALMKVVEEIEELGFCFIIKKSEVLINPPIGSKGIYNNPFRYTYHDFHSSKFELSYNAVVEFIKWYNENK